MHELSLQPQLPNRKPTAPADGLGRWRCGLGESSCWPWNRPFRSGEQMFERTDVRFLAQVTDNTLDGVEHMFEFLLRNRYCPPREPDASRGRGIPGGPA